MSTRQANSPRQLHVAPSVNSGIDADSSSTLMQIHHRCAAELATMMLIMRAGARVLVDGQADLASAGTDEARK